MRFIIALLISLALGFDVCPGQQTEDEIASVTTRLEPAVQVEGDPRFYRLSERMRHYNIPGVSIAILQDGELRWARGFGIANTRDSTTIDQNTLFQAGSISKPLAALGILKLAEEGRVDLDQNVNRYLKSWKLPSNKFTRETAVTLTHLLTHTAGTTVHGFPGYTQSDTMPTITKVLDGEGNTDPVRVDTLPGSIWSYSGGGYTVMEKVIEDVSGQPLEEYMRTNILEPMGMENSTYRQPLPDEFHADASAAYDMHGQIIEGLWHNYPEQAAAGLWTTPTDLTKYCREIQQIYDGKSGGVLSKATVRQMLTKHKNGWGLGPRLVGRRWTLRFQHGGKNAGFASQMICFAEQRAGVVIMTNADNGGNLIDEILRSVSRFYGWEIRRPQTIDPVALSAEKLRAYSGKYKYIKGPGDFVLDVKPNGKQLIIIDTIRKRRHYLVAKNKYTFLDRDNGTEIVFNVSTDSDLASLIINGQSVFRKIAPHDD